MFSAEQRFQFLAERVKREVNTLLTNLLGWVGLVGLGQLGLLVWLIDKLIDGLVHLILF